MPLANRALTAPLIRCLTRTTVWKDMVEHERRELSATVADDNDGRGSKSLLRRARRPLAIALSLAVFAVLLSALLAELPCFLPCVRRHRLNASLVTST